MAKKRNHKHKKGRLKLNLDSNGAARRVYFNRFCRLAKMTGCLEAFEMLTPKEKKRIYEFRIHLRQPKAAPACKLPVYAQKFFAGFCRSFRSNEMIVMVSGEAPVSVVDLVVVQDVFEYFEKVGKPERIEEVEAAFAPLKEALNRLGDPFDWLYLNYNKILHLSNRYDQTMYGFETSFECRRDSVPGVYHMVQIKSYEPRVSMVSIKGKKRPVYHLGWPMVNEGMNWNFLDVGHLGERYKGELERLPICIQSHAMIRLQDRAYPIDEMLCNYYSMICFSMKETFRIYKNKLMFAFYVLGVKIGYFLADLIENKIVVRTFLFVTHHYTPEGERLEKLSGLSKQDISYWKIDCLATFMENKLEENHKIHELFEKVGLTDLFGLRTKLEHEKWSNSYDWEALTAYIQQGKTELSDGIMEEELVWREADSEKIHSSSG